MTAGSGTSTPPPWLGVVAVAVILGGVLLLGGSGAVGGDPVDTSAIESPALQAPIEADITVPTVVIPAPTSARVDALGGTLAAVEGRGGDPDLVLISPNQSQVIHAMPPTFGPILFDSSRAEYGFLDGFLRLFLRGVDDDPAAVTLDTPVAFNVSSWAWSTDEPGTFAFVSFDRDGFLLSTNDDTGVLRPGRFQLVGFDSSGFYLTDVFLSSGPGTVLRKLDRSGDPVGQVEADLVSIGSSGVIVVGREQPDGYRWFLVDSDLGTSTPIPGPDDILDVAVAHGPEPRVAFLVKTAYGPAARVYLHDRGLTRTFLPADINPQQIGWSDDDRRLILSGIARDGVTEIAQFLEVDTGISRTLGFEEDVSEVQLLAMP